MRLTIITPTRNRARSLPAAIESVLAQGYPEVEHLIVDGLSTDETPAVLARYPHLRVIAKRMPVSTMRSIRASARPRAGSSAT